MSVGVSISGSPDFEQGRRSRATFGGFESGLLSESYAALEAGAARAAEEALVIE